MKKLRRTFLKTDVTTAAAYYEAIGILDEEIGKVPKRLEDEAGTC